MNKKILAALGLGAFALAVGMNLKHAIDNYGILYSNLAVQVVAQDNSSGGGGSDDGGASNGGGSNDEGGDSTGGGTGGGGESLVWTPGGCTNPEGYTKLVQTTTYYEDNGEEIVTGQSEIRTCYLDGPYTMCINMCRWRLIEANEYFIMYGYWRPC
jgi:hypothetical protein